MKMKNQMSDDNDKHIVKEEDGWYFWDEVGVEKYGPYLTKEDTRAKLVQYAVEVLDNKVLN